MNKCKFNLKLPLIAFGKAGQIFGKGLEKGGERIEEHKHQRYWIALISGRYDRLILLSNILNVADLQQWLNLIVKKMYFYPDF
jgi:hypothetical protein